MGKKRIIKKRAARKHITKPAAKDKLKETAEKFRSAVNGNMSKLEYEQSMMDPRFRAAMMGFNNPASNYNQQISNALHEHENKNNELTRQISVQNEIANYQKANHKLKEQLAQEKMQHQTDITISKLEMGIKRNEFEKQNLQQKFQYDTQIQQLNAQIADQNRIIQEQQQRHNQEQQQLQANHDLKMAELKAQHEKDYLPIQAAINDIARKSDLENLQFRGANEIADATYKKASAEINKQLQDTLHPMQEATAQSKREYDLAEQLHKQDIEIRKAEHEQVISEIHKATQDSVNPIKDNTTALNNLIKLEKERSKQKTELNDAITQKCIAEFRAATQPTVIALDEKAQTLNNYMQALDAQVKRIKEIKQAKFQLEQAEIDSISQPILQELESKLQDVSQQYQLNKKYFDEIMKQKEIQIKTAQLEQTVDSEARDKYMEKLKNEKLETHKLELIKAHAEAAHKAYLDKEQVRSKIIENAAKVLPGFNVEDIDKAEFTKRLLDKEMELRTQYVELAKQQEQTQRAINYQHKLDDIQFEHAEAAARLNTTTQPSSEYQNSINNAAQRKIQLQRELESFNKLNDDITDILKYKQQIIEKGQEGLQNFYDKHPHMKKVAEEYALQKHGNKELTLEEFVEVAKNEVTKAVKFEDALSKYKGTLPNSIGEKLHEVDKELQSAGININIHDTKYRLDLELEAKKTEINELHQDKASLQQRLNPTVTFANLLNNALIQNNSTY